MDFDELFTNVCEALRREQRISYRALRRRFELSDNDLEDLKVEIIEAKQLAVDENDRILVWIGDTESAVEPTPAPSTPEPTTSPTTEHERKPLSYTPPISLRKSSLPEAPLKANASRSLCSFAIYATPPP